VPRNRNRWARYIKNNDSVDAHVLSASRGDGLCMWHANVAGAREYLEAKQPRGYFSIHRPLCRLQLPMIQPLSNRDLDEVKK